MVQFVSFLQAAQNRDRVFHRGLGDQDWLKAPFKRGVLLDIFAIFVERGGADCAQLAASQRRLQHVRRVHRAFGRARAHQRVQFVDEQDDLPVGLGDFLEHSFQAVFKFAAILGSRDQGGEIQPDNALWAQNLRHVARNDPLREAFDNRGLADPGFADQDRIIFRPPGKNLHHAADFIVAADHGIEFPAPRELDQVAAVLFEGAECGLRILRSHAVAAAHGCERLQNCFARRAMLGQQFGRFIFADRGNRKQDVLGGNVLVLELLGFDERTL